MKIGIITAKMLRILCCSIILLNASLNLILAGDFSGQGQLAQEQSLVGLALKQGFRERGKPTPRKKTIAPDLCLHNLLSIIQSNIKNILSKQIDPKDVNGLEHKQDLVLAAQIAGDAVRLLEQIIFELNEQCFVYNPEIEYRFIRMCNTLRDVDFQAMEPHSLRTQYENTKVFDQYLKLYCLNRKDFLNIEDKKLFDKITKFNQMLMLRDHNGSNVLLNEDYFQISYFDTFTDYAVYRPWEFACEHPYLTAAVVGSIAAAVGYFYVYPWWIRYDNENKEFDVEQFHALKQGRGDCGYYTLLHALIRRNAENEEEFNVMIDRAKAQKNLLDPWKNFINRNDDDWLHEGDLARLMRNRQLIDQVVGPIIGNGRNVLHDNIVIVDVLPGEAGLLVQARRIHQDGEYNRRRIHRRNRIAEPFVPEPFDQENALAHIRANLQDLHVEGNYEFINQLRNDLVPQHIALNIGRHWVEVSIEPDANSKHGIRAKVINSMRPNITNNPELDGLLQACTIN